MSAAQAIETAFEDLPVSHLWVAPPDWSKSWSAMAILEAVEGWKKIIVGRKPEDTYLDFPMGGDDKAPRSIKKFGEILRARKMEPKGLKGRVDYLTFNYPRAIETVPINHTLASLTMSMLIEQAFALLPEALMPKYATRKILDAWYDARDKEATRDQVLWNLAMQKRELPPFALALMSSSLWADKSKLEPGTFLRDLKPFTVVSAGAFGLESDPIANFCIFTFLMNLLSHIIRKKPSERIWIHVREIQQLAPKIGARKWKWHTRELINTTVKLMRQMGTAEVRMSFEAQSVNQVPRSILESVQLVAIAPPVARSPEQRRVIEKFFCPMPPKLLEFTARRQYFKPGLWFMWTNTGYGAVVPIPPPLSFRVPIIKAKTKEKLREQKKQIEAYLQKLVPSRSLQEELDDDRDEYSLWRLRAREIGDGRKLPEVKQLMRKYVRSNVRSIKEVPKNAAQWLEAMYQYLRLNPPSNGIPSLTVEIKELALTGKKLGLVQKGQVDYLFPCHALRWVAPGRMNALMRHLGVRGQVTQHGDYVAIIQLDVFEDTWPKVREHALSRIGLELDWQGVGADG